MLKFSIIIPCYNHFEKMEKCLASLENQTYKNFEVIFVDDKSTDDLFQKLKDYKENSKLDIKLFQNEKNAGPGVARNLGIKHSKGEYITFLDADDYIEETALELICKKISEVNPDCIIFNYAFETKNGKHLPQKSYLVGEEGKKDIKDALVNSTGSTCSKVYKTQIIKENNVEFAKLKRCEDMVFNKIAISNCKSIYYYDKILYYYVINHNSIMNSKDTLSLESSKIAVEMVSNLLDKKFEKEIEAIYIKEYFYGILVTLVKQRATRNEIKTHISECEKKYENIYENYVIKNMTKFQKIVICFAERKNIFLLRIAILFKEFVKTIL